MDVDLIVHKNRGEFQDTLPETIIAMENPPS